MFRVHIRLLLKTRVSATERATPVTVKCSGTYRKLTRPFDPTGHAPAKQGDPFAPISIFYSSTVAAAAIYGSGKAAPLG